MSGKRVAEMTTDELEHVREQRRAAQARYRVTAAGKAAAHRYWVSEKGRENSKRAKTKARPANREKWTLQQRERNARQPERRLARYRVNRAVATGALVRPSNCQDCGRSAHLHGHHHRGYVGDAVLDVRWLCVPCHRVAHP